VPGKKHTTYVLLLFLPSPKAIRVGSLGKVSFRKGLYLYVGSGGKAPLKRLARHAARRKKKFWHIDYLSSVADVLGAFVFESNRRCECEIASSLRTILPSVKNFGSSDCRCGSHLFFFE